MTQYCFTIIVRHSWDVCKTCLISFRNSYLGVLRVHVKYCRDYCGPRYNVKTRLVLGESLLHVSIVDSFRNYTKDSTFEVWTFDSYQNIPYETGRDLLLDHTCVSCLSRPEVRHGNRNRRLVTSRRVTTNNLGISNVNRWSTKWSLYTVDLEPPIGPRFQGMDS